MGCVTASSGERLPDITVLPPIELADGSARLDRFWQPTARNTLRLEQRPLVIALQQEKALRVAGNDVHQAAALVPGQRLSGGRLALQGQGGFQLACVLLEALAVQGLTPPKCSRSVEVAHWRNRTPRREFTR